MRHDDQPRDNQPHGDQSSAEPEFVGPGHNESIGQPHDPAAEGPIAVAELAAAQQSTEAQPLGGAGKPFNWRTPFFVGLAGTAGVAITVGVIFLFLTAGHIMVLIGLALFLAIGMEPAVSWLVDHSFPRWLAVLTILLTVLIAFVGFLAAAVPPLVEQGKQLVDAAPGLLKEINDKHSFLGSINDKFDLEDKLKSALSSSGSGLADGILGAGEAVFSALTDALIVIVMTIYFLVDLPRIRAFGYRIVPHTRRPRAILIGDNILAKVGGYVLGNLLISLIVGVLTFVWLLIFGVPYALLIAILVAVLDLVPVVGAILGGVVACAVALTVSLPIAIGTAVYFVVYHLAEDYFLIPRIIGKAVEVPAVITVVAVLIGGALLGIVGALVAIPVAAALLLLCREMLFPRMDRT